MVKHLSMRGQPRNPRESYSHQKYFKTKGKMKTFSDKERQEQPQHYHFYTKKMLKNVVQTGRILYQMEVSI